MRSLRWLKAAVLWFRKREWTVEIKQEEPVILGNTASQVGKAIYEEILKMDQLIVRDERKGLR